MVFLFMRISLMLLGSTSGGDQSGRADPLHVGFWGIMGDDSCAALGSSTKEREREREASDGQAG
jgi:hypothetical protein